MSRILVTVIAIVVLTFAGEVRGQNGETPDRRAARVSHSAYVIVQGGGSPLPPLGIIAGELHPKLPGFSPDDIRSTSVKINFSGEHLDEAPLMQLVVSAQPEEPLSEAEQRELWNVAREELEAQLQRLAEMAQDARVGRLRRQIDGLEAERRDLDAKWVQLAGMLIEHQAKSAGADSETLAKAIAEATSKQRELQLREAGIRARQKAIENRIDELRENAAAKGNSIVDELEQLVEIRQQAKEALQHANTVTPGAVAKGQLVAADERIAEAKIEWLRAQRDAEDRIGGGALREMNNELSKLHIEAAEIDGQREQLKQIIEELRTQQRETARAAIETAGLENQLDDVRSRLPVVQANLDDLHRQVDNLDRPEIKLKPLAAVDEAEEDGEPEASAPGDSGGQDTPPSDE